MLLPNFFSLNYLVIQRYFLILRLVRILVFYPILVVRILIKLGLPPFHLWFVRLSRVLSKRGFAFIITLHKLLPIFLLAKILLTYISFLVFLRRIIIVGTSLSIRRTLFFTLTFSSIIHRAWIVLRVLIRKGFLLFYWFSYRGLLIILIRVLSLTKLNQAAIIQRRLTRKIWLLMSGIPPFIIFWLKVHIVIWFSFSLGFFFRIFIILVRVFALTSYYRTWHFRRILESRTVTGSFFRPLIIVLLFWGRF